MAAAPPKSLSQSDARACVIANLAVPGAGSLRAGRRVGYAQLAVAQTGFVLTLFWAGTFGREWLRRRELPVEFNPALLVGCAGVVVFLIGFSWALATSLAIVRAAHESRTPPRPAA